MLTIRARDHGKYALALMDAIFDDEEICLYAVLLRGKGQLRHNFLAEAKIRLLEGMSLCAY